ncbi:hypothetical protein ACQEU3_22310 [Spirillospora sp. CA-253888]
MERFQKMNDRLILWLHDENVVDVEVLPQFALCLTGDVCFWCTGSVSWLPWQQGGGTERRPLAELPSDVIATMISSRPLSWAIFNTGEHCIVLSSRILLSVAPGPADSWRLALGDGTVLTHSPDSPWNGLAGQGRA